MTISILYIDNLLQRSFLSILYRFCNRCNLPITAFTRAVTLSNSTITCLSNSFPSLSSAGDHPPVGIIFNDSTLHFICMNCAG
jgi:hypothetical protein